MPILRINAVRTEDPEEDRLTFDTVTDGNLIATGKIMTFGYIGSASKSSDQFYPFGISSDGAIWSFNSIDEPDEENEHLNHIGKKMVVGEYITFRRNDDEDTYRISQVLNLTEKFP